MPRINPIIMTSIKEMADVSMHLLRGAIPAAAVILTTLSGQAAWSQTARTIKIVVPYPPGGGVDILARLLADQIGRARGPTMVIENRPGAGTGIATEAVARAAPDGNTVLIADSNFVIIPHFRKLSYDPRISFEPICQLVSSPQLVVVNGTSPYRTLVDLVDAARPRPGDLTLASVGPASLPQIGFEMLKRAANVDITFVPYPGVAAAVNALLGGHVTSVFTSYASVGEQLKTGQLRALATITQMRIDPLPDVPTGVESGYNNLEAELWDGVVAPAKTPKEIIAEIAGWFAAALRDSATRQKLIGQGLLPVGTCGADFGALIRKQYDEYGRVVREANIKMQ